MNKVGEDMAQPQVVNARPDIDIMAELNHLLTQYRPLMHDRHNIQFDVQAGVVTVEGYVKSRPAYNYLLNALPRVEGVQAVYSAEFYSDEGLRLDVARVLPTGMTVTMEYGSAILSGPMPEDTPIEAIVRQVAGVVGIRRVLATLN